MSSRNALKHGILARSVVLHSDESGETQEEFDSLIAALCDEWQPVGRTEEILVERIAMYHWRLRRVLIMETGVLDQGLTNVEVRGILKQQSEHSAAVHGQAFNSLKRLKGNLDKETAQAIEEQDFKIRNQFRHSSLGLNRLLDMLDDLKRRLEKVNFLNDTFTEAVIHEFGIEDAFAQQLLSLNEDLKQLFVLQVRENVKDDLQGDRFRDLKNKALALIENRREAWELQRSIYEVVERQQLEARRRTSAIPDAESLDRIIRYQTVIEKEFYKAINQLERLQRSRKGEFVSPPASISIS